VTIPFKHYEVYYNYRYPDGIVRQRIGLVDKYGDDVEQHYRKGFLVIEDYILPSAHLCKTGEVTPIEEVIPAGTKPDNYMPVGCVITDAWQQHWMDLADEVSKKLKKMDVGAQFTQPVGDGSAHYVVTAFRKRKSECKIEWRGFSGDRWVCQMFGMGGWYRTKDIEPLCCIGAKELFGSFNAPWRKTWAELEKKHWVPPGMIEHTLQEA
jgi:hypothetical protein